MSVRPSVRIRDLSAAEFRLQEKRQYCTRVVPSEFRSLKSCHEEHHHYFVAGGGGLNFSPKCRLIW
jgi:hypothetical protein